MKLLTRMILFSTSDQIYISFLFDDTLILVVCLLLYTAMNICYQHKKKLAEQDSK